MAEEKTPEVDNETEGNDTTTPTDDSGSRMDGVEYWKSQKKRSDNEAANLRKRAKQAEEQLAALEEEKKKRDMAELSEIDRLKAQLAEFEQVAQSAKRRADTATKKSAALDEASAMGFRNPKLMSRAIDLDQVTLSSNGEVEVDSIRNQLQQLADEDESLLEKPEPPREARRYGSPARQDSERYPASRQKQGIDPIELARKADGELQARQMREDTYWKLKADAIEMADREKMLREQRSPD